MSAIPASKSVAASGSSPVDPLNDAALIVRLMSEVTARRDDEVRKLLLAELRTPGSTVAEEVRRRRITPYVHSTAMDAFYSESDAFLFESAVWNRNRLKHHMRRWVRKRLDALRRQRGAEALDVLVIGDGPGFDSLAFARAGHRVTYYELPGVQEVFARRLFESCGCGVRIVTSREEISRGGFDAVVCLDVLEHVDDPPAVVRSLTQYMRAGPAASRLFIHAPFYMIHPAYPTHLRANRRFSGSLAPYRRAGLRLLDGAFGWNPLMFGFESPDAEGRRAGALTMLAIRSAGVYLALGRWIALPMAPIHWMRCLRGRWFGE